jgi:hypothetical protein
LSLCLKRVELRLAFQDFCEEVVRMGMDSLLGDDASLVDERPACPFPLAVADD